MPKPGKKAFFVLKFVVPMLVVAWVALFFYLRSPVFSAGTPIDDAIRGRAAVLENHVRFLAGIQPPRQFKNVESMMKAEKYVADELIKLGYKVSLQNVETQGPTFHNLIARYGDPEAKEVLVLGAHYDVCGDQPGADDNASGVAGLLEIARLLKERAPDLKIPIELVAYTLEEPPFFGGSGMGSAVHAESLKAAGATVRLAVSLEMIGFYSSELFSQKFPMGILYGFYSWTGDFIGVVGTPADRDEARRFKKAMSANSEVPVLSVNAPRALEGIDFSDHRSYWTYNWPGLMITDTAFYRNDQYHEPGDTPDRLDYRAMAEVVRGVYAAVTQIAAE